MSQSSTTSFIIAHNQRDTSNESLALSNSGMQQSVAISKQDSINQFHIGNIQTKSKPMYDASIYYNDKQSNNSIESDECQVQSVPEDRFINNSVQFNSSVYHQKPISRSHSTAAHYSNNHINEDNNSHNNRNSQYSITSATIYSHQPSSMLQKFSSNLSTIKRNSQSNIPKRTFLEDTNQTVTPAINVAGMLLNGFADGEIMRTWLASINCEEYCKNFLDNGYDMPTITRMTPQDLTAIGCTIPALRKKLQTEIRRLNIDDGIPECRPPSYKQWLDLLRLEEYYNILCDQGYDTIDKVCDLTWEDFEDIGITKLGHQKRLLVGIERIKKYDKKQEQLMNDHAIYDVHPNHKLTLHHPGVERNEQYGTLRSGLAHLLPRSGQSRGDVGPPVATVMPALKHVNNNVGYRDSRFVTVINNEHDVKEIVSTPSLTVSGSNSTMKRNPPPLPPMRTNSLRIAPMSCPSNNNIYGNHHSTTVTLNGPSSFSRASNLGTPILPPNVMFANGGHIQAGSMHPVSTTIPIREAPLPPIYPMVPKIDEEPIVFLPQSHERSFPSSKCNLNNEEFPPPPSPTNVVTTEDTSLTHQMDTNSETMSRFSISSSGLESQENQPIYSS